MSDEVMDEVLEETISETNAVRESGTVKWFNNVRGYGFITRGDETEDIFVHFRNIRGDGYRSLFEGQQVKFELTESDRGLQAEDVECL